MSMSESKIGVTPNGGTRSIIYYQDEKGNPVDKSKAVRAEVIELDELGNTVGRTYATLT